MKVAASAVSAAMGPIEVVPGSVHSPPDSAHAATALPLPLPVGAVNIYDARLWHRGGKNRSQQPRMLFYVTVVGDGPPPAGLPYTEGPGPAGLWCRLHRACALPRTNFRGSRPLARCIHSYTIEPSEVGCFVLNADGVKRVRKRRCRARTIPSPK